MTRATHVPSLLILTALAGACAFESTATAHRVPVPVLVAAAVARAQSSDQDTELAARLASLSPQQFRVLTLVAQGLLTKQIAADSQDWPESEMFARQEPRLAAFLEARRSARS